MQSRNTGRALVAGLVLPLWLAACGGGADDPGGDAPQADAAALAAAKAVATLTSRTGSELPWNVRSAVEIALRDENGKLVPARELRCKPQSRTALAATLDCSALRPLRLGPQKLLVSGGGAAAVITVVGVPQRQWLGASAASDHTLSVVTPKGKALAWGSNDEGRLGQNKSAAALASSAVPLTQLDASGKAAFDELRQVSSGEDASLALDSAGRVYSWGSSSSRQLGRDQTATALLPGKVTGLRGSGQLDGVVQVAIAEHHAAALRDDGEVIGWADYIPRFGVTENSYDNLPVRVLGPNGKTPLGGIVAVAAAHLHTLALHASGRVYVWGYEVNGGTLGLGAPQPRPVLLPKLVRKKDRAPLDGIVAIAAGYSVSLALDARGGVWAWGGNREGQLGNGSTSELVAYAAPVKSPSGHGRLDQIAMVAAGQNHALALGRDGTVYAWGFGTSGQLGDGPARPTGNGTALPRQVVNETADAALSGIVSIAAAGNRSYALRADGTVLSWGDSYFDGLGRPATATDATPAPVLTARGPALKLAPSAYPNLLQRGR